MPTALAQVREMLGADAVIISQEKNAAGEIELTAAVEDADEISFNREEQVEVRPTRWKYDDEKLRESLDYHGVLDIVKERVLARCRKISAEENLTDEKKLLTRCFEEMFRFQDILDCRQPVKMFMGVPGSGKSTAIAKAATQAKPSKAERLHRVDRQCPGRRQQPVAGFCRYSRNRFSLCQNPARPL